MVLNFGKENNFKMDIYKIIIYIKNMGNRQVRGTIIESEFQGSAPLTEEALEFIKKHTDGSKVLEIGCGSGIYAKLLRDIGVEVKATDACRINKEELPPPNNRMAKFTNVRAINNVEELNAVNAVKMYGQDLNTSLFLSFPLPANYNNSSAKYDEKALREFKGNKFFLIAMYQGRLPHTPIYDKNYANESTGSTRFHRYLASKWLVKDKLLLEDGRLGPDTHCYLIYFERKPTIKKPATNMSGSGGTNRKCPKNNAKDFKLKTVNTGLDGNLWIVSKRSDGVIFWKRK